MRGILRVLVLLGVLGLVYLWFAPRGVGVEPGSVLVLDIQGEYVEAARPPLLGRVLGDQRRSFLGLYSHLRKAERGKKLASNGTIELTQRSYRPADLKGTFLVIGATDDENLNQQISKDAEKSNTLCNIADRPEVCNFILPSIVRRGDLVITISTSGKSPALAKQLRQKLETQFGQEYAELLLLMGAIRKKLLSEAHEPEAHKDLFNKLIDSDLIELIQSDNTEEINSLLYKILGEGYTVEDLL